MSSRSRRQSWPLFVSLAILLTCALALPAGPAFAGSDLQGESPAGGKEEKKKNKDDAGKKGEVKDDKEQPKEPPFEKVVKGAQEIKGLFNAYIKDDEGKVYLEILPDQLDKPFLLNPTLVSGIGQGFLYPADMLPEYLVSFHRIGKTIQLIHRNTLFRADATSSLSRPASVAAPDAIVGQTKIESQPHPDRKSVLVDLGPLFLADLEGLTVALKQVLEVPYQVDRDGSSVVAAKAFPTNFDFDTVLHLKTPVQEFKRPIFYAADPRSLLVRFHYSIAPLPDTGFRPRLADDRVGHFPALLKDYTDDRPEDPTTRYVNRWHLEKQDPDAALSEPKQPIVFYIENSIPPEYRQAVKDGITGWNAAFEAIGFKNALVAKDQPDDPDWDAADVRYSTIRWIVAPNAGFAQGPSRVNPYTGQIFDADIRFSADMIRNIRREYEFLVTPTAAANAAAEAPWRALIGWLPDFSLESIHASLGGFDAPPVTRPLLGAGARPGAIPAAIGYCDYAGGMSHQAALGWSVLLARGLMTPAAEAQYLNDFITHVTLHEVGHTLGLRHNFKASNLHAFDQLHDRDLTRRTGLTGSVMDYIPVNLAPEGKPQGEYYQTTVGPYDRWAIEYAYTPIAAATPEAEKPALAAIAARAADPALAYGTDEDTMDFGRGIDPTSNRYDNGRDIVDYYASRAAIARELFAKMEDRFSEPGTRYQTLRRVFAEGIAEFAPAAANLPKFIGGIRHNRDHIGDPNGRLPYVPVPAAEQRAALDFLTREIFGAAAFAVPPRLLNKLAIERLPDIEGSVWMAERNDLPIHTLVLAIQSMALDRLYAPIVLSKLADVQARVERPQDALTMADLFAGVRRAVWSEVDGRQTVNSFRRNLQRRHLTTLVNLVVGNDPAVPEDARTLARADLLALQRGINALIARDGRALPAGGRLDAISRAHLDESRARITAALEAGIERQMGGPRG
jgi:hypothetical protein